MEMTAKGTVQNIIYRNEEDGYTVIALDTTDGDTITCVGYFPTLSIGAVLAVKGKVSTHQRFGEQLVVEEARLCNPTTKQGIIKYLSSGLIKGIGEVTATHIYEMFGDDTFGVIEQNPALLARVKGISVKKALDIANAVASLKEMQQQIMFLQGYGITVNLAVKIFNVYKGETIKLVKENPYRLIDDIDGVGFLTADKIAQSMGHETVSEFRIRAAIVYCLKDSAEKQGNTYLVFDELMDKASELLSLDLKEHGALVETTVTKLVLEPVVTEFEVDHVRCIALNRYYKLEKAIANRLMQLNRDAKRFSIDADTFINQFEKTNNLEFHKSQRGAVKSALTNGVTVITGGPGTGKTTIIRCIAEVLSAHGQRIAFCAPTGRATKRLSESTGREAKTIHRLLGFEFESNKIHFKYNKDTPLPCDVIICDELSMVDVVIMYNLLSALENGTRLVLVGDKDQLPSVGAGNVLADIIHSGTIDVRYLTHIYRQSEDSLIVSNAHLINKCQMPEINNHSKDFFFMNMDDFDAEANTVVQLVTKRLPSFSGLSPESIQVLGALKNGTAGVENLNKLLQDALNPREYGKGEVLVGKTTLRSGDRVMQTVNNYQLEFTRQKKDGTVEEGTGVFNGDIGYITEVDRLNGRMSVLFDDGRLAEYSSEDFADLQLAYACTVHKSQGSEFDIVVVSLVNGPPTIINKNLLYTAITRAKKMVVIVGSKKILGMMIHNNYIATRTTNLCRFLQEEARVFKVFFNVDVTPEETESEDDEE